MHRIPLATLTVLTALPLASAATAQNVLVMDHEASQHSFLLAAAQNLGFSNLQVADTLTFEAMLTSQNWDLVLLDLPSAIPVAGFTSLNAYVTNGGRSIMSFWNWDVEPQLTAAYGVTVASSFAWGTTSLVDSGTTAAFAGVTMPNGEWHNHWGDDGDEFIPGAGVGLAHIGNPATPVMVLANSGRTIAMPVIDEAGDTWVNDGSAIQLYENLIQLVLNGGTLGTNYCSPATANSSGGPAEISASGSRLTSNNDLTLTASSLPLNSFGFFLNSQMQGTIVNPGGSQGTLCLGGAIGRYVGPGEIQNSGASGEFSLALDLTMTPQPTGFVSVMATETWNFQAWFRDSTGGMATSNFTDGLEITFL